MTKTEARQQKALLLLLARPEGLRPAELSLLLETTTKQAQAAIAPLIKDGRIAALGTHGHRVYAAPQFAEAIKLQIRERSLNRRRAAQRRYKAAKRRERGAPIRGEGKAGAKIVQRKVSAASAKPLKKLGPASVFELGAM